MRLKRFNARIAAECADG